MAKHHYNPNFILRRFAHDSGTLWVLDKDTGRCWPKRGGRQDRYDAFAENGYNTVKDACGADDDSVEDFYTEVEARAAPIIDTMVNTADAGLLPHIGLVDKEHLVRFLWAQHIRSPYERNAALENGTARLAMEEAVLDASVEFDIPPSDIYGLLSKDLQQMMSDAVIKAPTTPEERDSAVVLMCRMPVDLLKVLPSISVNFITSDRSCLVEPIGQHGGNVVMPIAKNLVIRLSRPEDPAGGLVNVGVPTVDRINRRLFDTARRYVAGPCRTSLSHVPLRPPRQFRRLKRTSVIRHRYR